MLALLFPGQGSQSVGMCKFLHDEFSEVRDIFTLASDTLGMSFEKLCFEGPESELQKTENTQPALVLASIAYYKAIQKVAPLSFAYSAGHSLGEYSALVVNEVIDLPTALRLVRARGQAMQEAVPVGQGAMLAVMGMSDSDVEKMCAWVSLTNPDAGSIQAANFNAPGQVVISGTAAAAEYLQKNFSPDKIGASGRVKFIPLKVSAPFHCRLMQPAQDKMKNLLEKTPFQNATHPIIQNFDALAHSQAIELRMNLVSQVTGSVRWTASVQNLLSLGVKDFLEVGPGKVLSGLVKKIDSSAGNTFNINSLEDLKTLENKWT